MSKRVLPIASGITFLGFLDTHLLIPVIALYAAELGAGVGIIGLVIGLYSMTNTPANILFGRLIDRLGYRVPLIAGLVGDALSMFLYSICPSWIYLALVRAFHGVSGGLIGPATMSIAADYSAGTEKGRTMGYYGMAIATATLVGYGSGGVIASRLGYGAVFQIGAGLLVAGALFSLFLPSRKKINSPAVDNPLPHTLKQVKGLLCRKGLLVSYSTIFAQYFTFGGVVTLLPIYLNKLGLEAFHVGILMATFAIMFIVTQFPASILSDKTGRLTPVISGLILGIISLFILPSMEALPLLAAVMALYGISCGLLFPSILAFIVDGTVSEERGLATGIFHALLTAGVAIGAPAIGWLGEEVGIRWGLMSATAVLILALIIALIDLKSARAC